MKRERRSIRLHGYDYSRAGAYFVTICTQDRECMFGEIADGEMVLNDTGRVAEQCWCDIPKHFPHVELDEYVIMPNHFHGIVIITVGATHASPLPMPQTTNPAGPNPRSIGAIVGSFKSAVTKRINEMRRTPGVKLWQRNYYERIIRDENELNRVREYVIGNPTQWDMDRENPSHGRVSGRFLNPPR